VVAVMAASVQDRDGAKTTLLGMYLTVPVRFVFADARFAGRLVDWAAAPSSSTAGSSDKDLGQRHSGLGFE
jgi:hypothetical protein